MQHSQQMGAQESAQPAQQPGAQMAPAAQQQAQTAKPEQQGGVRFQDWAAI